MNRPWWTTAGNIAIALAWIGTSAAIGWHLTKAVLERLG